MPLKDYEARLAYNRKTNREWYARNREQVQARVKELRKENREKWRAFKRSLSCVHCGEAHPAIIDFHHKDREAEKFQINRLVANNAYAKAYAEAAKCVVLCANCHRRGHYFEHHGPPADERERKFFSRYFLIPDKPSGVGDDNDSG